MNIRNMSDILFLSLLDPSFLLIYLSQIIRHCSSLNTIPSYAIGEPLRD